MEKKNSLKPPYCTVSCSLLLSTLFVFGMVFYAYFFLYQDDIFYLKTKNKIESKTIHVKPSDNLMAILENIGNFTILSLESGKYSGNFCLINREGIEILGKESILHTPNGATLTLEGCSDCTIKNLSIEGDDEKSPALLFSNVQNVVLEKVKLKNPFQALKIQAQSKKIVIAHSHISGEIRIENSGDLALKENELESSTENPVIIIEKAMQLELHKNNIKSRQGIWLKKISIQENALNTITQNTLSSFKNALVMEECKDFLLTWNDISCQDSGAISLLRCQGIMLGKNDFGNKVKCDKGHALCISGSKQLIAEDSWYQNQDTSRSAVYIISSSDIVFSKNQVIGLASYEEGMLKELKGGGIVLCSTIKATLQKNYIQESQIGIRLEKESEAVLKNNKIENNWGNGIEIENSDAAIGPENTISQNNTGIVLKYARGEISENSILENKEDGILLENSSPKIQKNRILKNNDNGIRMKNNSSPSLIQNHFVQNKGFGISFLQPATVSWKSENFFQENSKGPTDRMNTQ